jgi:hypothetical protein
VTIDPGEQVCRDRAADRPSGTLEGITAWYHDADSRLTPGVWAL